MLLFVFVRVEEIYFCLFNFSNYARRTPLPSSVRAHGSLLFVRHDILFFTFCIDLDPMEFLSSVEIRIVMNLTITFFTDIKLLRKYWNMKFVISPVQFDI